MLIRAMFAAILLALTVVACSSDDTGDATCVRAFRDSQPRAGAPYQVGPLDDAIRRCASLAEWRDAWVRVPEAHPPGADVVGYLRERCATAELAAAPLCSTVLPAS